MKCPECGFVTPLAVAREDGMAHAEGCLVASTGVDGGEPQ